MVFQEKARDAARLIGFVAYVYGQYDKDKDINPSDERIEKFAQILLNKDSQSEKSELENLFSDGMYLNKPLIIQSLQEAGIDYYFADVILVKYNDSNDEISLKYRKSRLVVKKPLKQEESENLITQRPADLYNFDEEYHKTFGNLLPAFIFHFSDYTMESFSSQPGSK